jgi:single-stranded DNA-specific DHH superfamily exonuclease
MGALAVKLFSASWMAAREETAQRMAAIAEERRKLRAQCVKKSGKKVVAKHLLKRGEIFVVPDYLEQSAGMVFTRCRRCEEWVA